MPNFMNEYKHPFNEVQILDQSGATQKSTPTLPLHMPFFPIRASKGRSTPFYCTGAEAIAEYGEQTFDQHEKFYRNEQYYLVNAIFNNQAAWLVRITPDDAKVASTVIEVQLSKDVAITQYQRDEDNCFVLDENGDKIVLKDELANPIEEIGCKIKFTKRAMTDKELEDNYVRPQSYQIGDETYTSYPIATAIYKSPCAEGNRAGFQLYYDNNAQVDDIVDSVNALLYSFTPVEQPYNSNVAVVVKDIYSGTVNQMTLKENTIDPYTERRLFAGDAITRLYYNTSSKKELLPFDIKFYTENIEIISKAIAEYEINHPEFEENPYLVNILSLTDRTGAPYFHAELDETGNDYIQMNNMFTHFLEGGEDGDLSDETFEAGYRDILKFRKFPELVNNYRFPITHIYDVGYTLDTKYAMIDFMAKQKRCKVILAAQDMHRHLYTMDEAASLGAALRARAAITPESTYYGTPALRATIFGQSGYVNDVNIGNIIPMTFWSAMRRAMYHNGVSIKGTWTEYPNNVVDIYRKYNFLPDTPDQREVLWDGAVNYFQAATMNSNFLPSIRSIYKDQSSVLSDEEFTDACVYLMAICDFVWVLHVGKTGVPFAKYKSLVEEDINKYAYRAFGDRYAVSATVYITEGDVERKDSLHIDTILTGYRPYRRWFNTIICRGEDVAATVSTEI